MESVQELDSAPRKAVMETLDKLHDGHASVHVHKLEGVPFVSFNVNQGGLRVICQREGGTLLLFHVGKHDPAYEWARRHKTARIGRHFRLVRTELATDTPGAEHETVSGPLAAVDDACLARFDVGPHAAQALRAVPTDDALIDLLTHFPAHRGEALLSLSLDPSEAPALEAAYRSDAAQAAAESAASSPLASVARDEVNAAQLWTVSPEDEAFRRALSGDFAAWRVFLHPSQAKLVRFSSKGALKITGGPGTGKTVVALHRARHLADTVFTTDPRPVLLTAFSAVLSRQMEEQLKVLAGGPSARVVVRSLTKVAQDVLAAAGRPHALVTELDELWAEALGMDDAGRGRPFYEAEREVVLARADAWTEAEYLKAPRTGRTTRLDRAGRKAIWRVLELFETKLVARGGGDTLVLAREATRALAAGTPSPFSAIVVDEAQDLGPTELRLLARLAGDGTGSIRPNALTLCADGYQRLFRAPVSLLSCGIDTRGRARTLRLNYRTTEPIRRAAVRVVEGSADVVTSESAADGEAEVETSLDGYRALRGGPAPESQKFDTAGKEADWIAKVARESGGSLLVLARTRAWLDALKKLLVNRNLTPRLLGSEDVPQPDDTLLLCTLHRAKGLEAPRVIIAGRQLMPQRFPGGDTADKALWTRKENSLLYVGMTRARDWCAVSSVGERSSGTSEHHALR